MRVLEYTFNKDKPTFIGDENAKTQVKRVHRDDFR